MLNFQGDLASYLQKKGRLSPSKALRFALDIARQVIFFRIMFLKELYEHIFYIIFMWILQALFTLLKCAL